MVQTKNDQAVTTEAMTPVIRVGLVIRVDRGMVSSNENGWSTTLSVTALVPVIRR